MKKMCTKCKELKDLSGFNKRSASCDGLSSECKTCVNARSKRYYYQNREKIIERTLKYERENGDKVAKRKNLYTLRSREMINKKARGFRLREPDKYKARYKLNNAVKLGKIERQPCEDCGSENNIEAHHHKGYDEENWLNVQWLCVPCHRLEDARLRKVERSAIKYR